MLEVALHNTRQHRQFQQPAGSVVLARTERDEAVWTNVDQVRTNEAGALLEIVPQERGIELQMVGCEGQCFCGRPCPHTGSCQLELPARFTIGDTRFEIAGAGLKPAAEQRPLETLDADKTKQAHEGASRGGPSPATLSRWFAALGTLNRWATSTQELFAEAARSAVEAIGLDGAVVVRRRDEAWEIAASHLPHPELGIHCDLAVLDELLTEPRTLFHGTAEMPAAADAEHEDALLALTQDLVRPTESMYREEPAVVVSPLFNAAGTLCGAVYGFRSLRSGNARRGIRYLEAHLIELLAGAVSEAIARLEHEAEVDRRRVLLEQAFVASLEQDPQRIVGERREVTMLFADLRNFSEIASALEMEQTYELLGQVMDVFTAAVMDHDGLIVDYYGDGLAAMWNAPASQADHPELACRAALRMVEMLPAVEHDWAALLAGHRLRLGVGVHTGQVQVGNAGSSRRLKYGPRGTNVHLTSRVEAATKLLELPVVVTRETAERLSSRVASYRVCRAELPGIEESVELYGICVPAAYSTEEIALGDYHRALELFEKGQYDKAAEVLEQIDPSLHIVPSTFLAGEVQKKLHQQHGRRQSDQPDQSPSVITLKVK